MMCKCYEASYKLAKKVRKKENPNGIRLFERHSVPINGLVYQDYGIA